MTKKLNENEHCCSPLPLLCAPENNTTRFCGETA